MFVISYNVTLQDRSGNLQESEKVVRKSEKKWWEVYGEKKKDKPKKELDSKKIDDSASEISEPVVENEVIEKKPIWVQRNGKTEKLQK